MYIFLCCATCIYEGATCISDGVENLCETLDSASNMVIHDSKPSAQVWAGIKVDMAVLVYPLLQNSCETLDSASNLRRALGIMYYMVIHDSKRSAQVWAWIRVDMAVLVYPLWQKSLRNLGFCIKLGPSAWNQVLHGDTWFKAFGAGSSRNKSWYGQYPLLPVSTR